MSDRRVQRERKAGGQVLTRATQGEPLRHCAYCGTWIGGTGEVCADCRDLPRLERPTGALAIPVCPDCGDYVETGPTCPTRMISRVTGLPLALLASTLLWLLVALAAYGLYKVLT